jgi:hypothetical protein
MNKHENKQTQNDQENAQIEELSVEQLREIGGGNFSIGNSIEIIQNGGIQIPVIDINRGMTCGNYNL